MMNEKWLSPVDLAYAAGLIDGEGYIGIAKTNKKTGRHSYQLCLQVAMVETEGLEFLQHLFGGVVYARSSPNPNGRDYSIWIVHSNRDIVNALQWLQPHLRVKKKHADIVLSSEWSYFGSRHPSGKFMKMPDEEWTLRSALFNKIKAANRRGTISEILEEEVTLVVPGKRT